MESSRGAQGHQRVFAIPDCRQIKKGLQFYVVAALAACDVAKSRKKEPVTGTPSEDCNVCGDKHGDAQYIVM